MNKYTVSYKIETYSQYVSGNEPHSDIFVSLDQYVEADSQDEAIENAIDYLRDHCDGDTDLITDHYEDGFQTVCSNEIDNQYFTAFTAKIVEIDDINAIMADKNCSQKEAERYIKDGTVVYDITNVDWDSCYADEYEGITLEEIKQDVGGHWGYVEEYEGHEFVISYAF